MKKTACTCLLLFIIIAIHAQTLRNTIALNGNWRFIIVSTNAGLNKQWAAGCRIPGTPDINMADSLIFVRRLVIA